MDGCHGRSLSERGDNATKLGIEAGLMYLLPTRTEFCFRKEILNSQLAMFCEAVTMVSPFQLVSLLSHREILSTRLVGPILAVEYRTLSTLVPFPRQHMVMSV